MLAAVLRELQCCYSTNAAMMCVKSGRVCVCVRGVTVLVGLLRGCSAVCSGRSGGSLNQVKLC